MTPESAETLALEAVSHIAEDDDLLTGFLAQTGMGVDDLKEALTDADSRRVTLAGVLDYLLLNDEWVISFASKVDLNPEKVMSARAALPGGDYMRSI